MIRSRSALYHGIAVSPGIAIGEAYALNSQLVCALRRRIVDENELGAEIERFRSAVDELASSMERLAAEATERFEETTPISIFEAHARLMQDPSLIRRVETTIREENCNVEWALKLTLEFYQEKFSRFKESYYTDRLQDIEQTLTRVQSHLASSQTSASVLRSLSHPVILVADDLAPSETLRFDLKKILGIALDSGGASSHVGILAASMEIPAVVGLQVASRKVRTGDKVILDALSGTLTLRPTKAQMLEQTRAIRRWDSIEIASRAARRIEAVTKDGHRVKVMANIESARDIARLTDRAADGIGLFRSEYIFLNRKRWPSEEEQYAQYKKIAMALEPDQSGAVRTLDIGVDKMPIARARQSERNPALGLRAIRYSLSEPHIFKKQLKAIARAAAHGPLRILYPLISSIEEIDRAGALLSEAIEQARREGKAVREDIEVGVMIETPAAVMLADELAERVDFFAVGTNDLIQFTMAADRANERVAYLYQPLAPAILRMIHKVARAAEQAQIPMSICGEMAREPICALLLLGMPGSIELSTDCAALGRIKNFIGSISIEDARATLSEALTMRSERETRDLVRARMERWRFDRFDSELIENARDSDRD